MPSRTSRTSAPTASHRLDTALTKLSLVARKALEAYLMVSAVAASVTISGAWVDGEQRAHPGRGGLVVGADHDAVGVQGVVDGRALAQELGVRHHRHVGAVEELLDEQGRAHRDGGLVDDDGAVLEVGRDLDAPRPRGSSRRPRRRRPGGWARTGRRTPHPAPPRWRRARTRAGPSRARRRRMSPRPSSTMVGSPRDSCCDLGRVRLAADHLVPEVGEDDRGGEPDVAGADHRRGHRRAAPSFCRVTVPPSPAPGRHRV